MRTAIILTILSLLLFQSNAQEINPFESIGKEGKIITLSKGKYLEIQNNDSLQRIGSVIVNMYTGELYELLDIDTLYRESDLNPTIITRWWSVDPLSSNFPSMTPYNGFDNNPIFFIDPTGMASEGWGGKTTKTTNEDGSVSKTTVWTWREDITSSNYKDLKFDEYMDEGQKGNFTITDGNYTGNVYLFGDGTIGKLDAAKNPDSEAAAALFIQPIDSKSSVTPGGFDFGNGGGAKMGAPLSAYYARKNQQMDEAVMAYAEFWMMLSGAGEIMELGQLSYYGIRSYMKYAATNQMTRQLAVNTVKEFARETVVHGNSLASTKPTWGYKLFLQDGTFLKNGITSATKAESRYTRAFMADKYMDKFPFPNRMEAYQWEFQQNSILRGPLNLNLH